MKWTVIDTGASSAKRNMEIDSKLLAELDSFSTSPILHLYEWERPCATYGHFLQPADHLSMEGCDLELAKRPTGGGVIFHTNDWAFSLLVPAAHEAFSINTLDNYAYVNYMLIDVIGRFIVREGDLSLLPTEIQNCKPCHFCMAKPTKYDVMLDGKKVCGGAQRRTKAGFLHQGTISLSLPDKAFLDGVLLNSDISTNMFENTYQLLPDMSISEARRLLKEAFLSHLQG